jgi:hypothetical protein
MVCSTEVRTRPLEEGNRGGAHTFQLCNQFLLLQILSRTARQAGASPKEQSEVDLGLNCIEFQYHSLVVFLTRRRVEERGICLASARSALSLLEALVSNSSQVYNGIVW